MIVYVESEKANSIARELLEPDISDERFRIDRTVFLSNGYKLAETNGKETVEGAVYIYSEQIAHRYDKEASDSAWKAVEQSGAARESAASIEIFLRTLLSNETLELVHVVSGVNRSFGYAFRAYGYIDHGTS